MKNYFKLSNNEKQIMTTLWKEARPLTRGEILKLTKNKTWSETSIHGLINSLLSKGAIEVADIVRSGKVFARNYKASLTKTEYEFMQFKNNFNKLSSSKLSLPSLISYMVDTNNLDVDDLDEIEELIETKKRELYLKDQAQDEH